MTSTLAAGSICVPEYRLVLLAPFCRRATYVSLSSTLAMDEAGRSWPNLRRGIAPQARHFSDPFRVIGHWPHAYGRQAEPCWCWPADRSRSSGLSAAVRSAALTGV